MTAATVVPFDSMPTRPANVHPLRDLRAAGCSLGTVQRLCRRRRIRQLARGIYALDPEPASTWGRHRELAAAALLRVHSTSVVSHRSAAVLRELPVWGDDRTVRVTVCRPTPRALEGLAVHVAPLRPADLDVVGDLPTTSLGRTLVDVSRTQGVAAGLIAADAALHRTHTRAGDARRLLQDWDRALLVATGWPGIVDGRRVRDLASPLAESPLESLLRLRAQLMELPPLDLQVEITGPGWRYRADAVVRGTRVIIECDGKIKYRDDREPGQSALRSVNDQVWSDRQRDWRLSEAGWIVVHVTWDDVAHHPERLRRRIIDAIGTAERLTVAAGSPGGAFTRRSDGFAPDLRTYRE